MNYTFKQLYNADLQRYEYAPLRKTRALLKYFRKCQTSSGLLFQFYRWRFSRLKERSHIEIYGKCNIGPGLYLGHAYCITINPSTIIGKNCNIHKGVTIGQENRGPRKGAPTIGDCVWIGVNATIVGNIIIGNDVLIAPNSYVNCDVPSHSVVFGNPCIIKHKEKATEGYINHKYTI